MPKQTVPVQHTPLWNARATTILQANRNRSLAYNRRPSTAEGTCGCQRHLAISSSCMLHPEDNSHNCFSQSYHGGGAASSYHNHSDTALPRLNENVNHAVGGCECNSSQLFDPLKLNDLRGYLWILKHPRTTDDERAVLQEYLSGQQEWPDRKTVNDQIEPQGLAQVCKKRRVCLDSATIPIDKTPYEQEYREFEQWMWSLWDQTMEPSQIF